MDLSVYISSQIDVFLPGLFSKEEITEQLRPIVADAHEKSITCLCRQPAFRDITSVDALHSRQYSTLLYFVGRIAHAHDARLSQGVSYLNKILHGVDIFGHIVLPEIFVIGHTSGIVLGSATYGENLVFFHGVTVGRYLDQRPRIGKNVILFSDVQVLGRSQIGDGVVVSAGTRITNQVVPDNTIVFQGSGNDLVFKDRKKDYISSFIAPHVTSS